MSFPMTGKILLSKANKTIWIFGAGASFSKPYNVPIQANLLDTFTKIKPPDSGKDQDEFENRGQPLTEDKFQKRIDRMTSAVDDTIFGGDDECQMRLT